MNSEAQVIAARAACKGKTFATDPEAFKDLEAAKVQRNAADPNHLRKKYAKWAEESTARGAGWRVRHWQAYENATESDEVMIRWGLRR